MGKPRQPDEPATATCNPYPRHPSITPRRARWTDDGLDAEAISHLMREVRELARALEGTATSRVRFRSGGLEVEVERAGGVIASAAAGSLW